MRFNSRLVLQTKNIPLVLAVAIEAKQKRNYYLIVSPSALITRIFCGRDNDVALACISRFPYLASGRRIRVAREATDKNTRLRKPCACPTREERA